jgi:hypothetical protein
MRAKREIDHAWSLVKRFCSESDHLIGNEIKDPQGKFLGHMVKHGHFDLMVLHPPEKEFFQVIFQINFDPEIVDRFKQMQKDGKWSEFWFTFVSLISDPGYGYATTPANPPSEFRVVKNIFPFHDGFGIKDLDEACQGVVSLSLNGINYLNALFSIPTRIETTGSAPPYSMYV